MARNSKKCTNCSRYVSLSNYNKHVNSCCNKKKSTLVNESWKQNNDKYKCPYCDKEFTKKGICSHIWRLHEEGKEFKPYALSYKEGRFSWNKGLKKDTDYRVMKNSENASKAIRKLIADGKRKKYKPNKEYCERLSIKQSLNNSGGKCKWYDVSGQKVQGTWERDFAYLMNDLNIKWLKIKNNKDSFIYYKDDKLKNYTPDFYIEEIDKFIEIKGFWWGNDKEKMRLVIQNNNKLKQKLLIIEKDLFKDILKVNCKDIFFELLKKGTINKANL